MRAGFPVPHHPTLAMYKHGLCKHPLYLIWVDIKGRCYRSSHQDYHLYGGRGIKMYKSWINNPALFIRWIEKNLGPRLEKHSLDRINNDGNYIPGNLRWATSREQARNRRPSKREFPAGVYKRNGYFHAVFRLHLGSFDTAEKAIAVNTSAYEKLEEIERILDVS